MRNIDCFGVAVYAIVAAGSVVILNSAAAAPRVVHLWETRLSSTFDGWGTSLGWFANAVGRWPEPQRTEIADALFSREGLGLTVVRYNIGGGEAPAHHHMPAFRQMDGFESQAGAWNWEADPGQRWMLQAAVQRGANRLEAFSNSPPYWMTVSRCASGATDASADNLRPTEYPAFIDYLTTVLAHFRSAWAIQFETVDPLNEPYTNYWHTNGQQEGCHFDRQSQARLIQELRKALDERGLQSVKISASDETNYEKAIGTWDAFDARTHACIGQINAHGYAPEHRSELHRIASEADKPLVMSEEDGAGAVGHSHVAIEPALVLAANIVDDFRDLRPLRWVVWQAVEDEAGQTARNKNWGLIHADLSGQTHSWAVTKKYYAMANFSKFIRPGSVLLACDNSEVTAVYDAIRGSLVIVALNSSSALEPTDFDVTRLAAGAQRVSAYRTSATEDLATLPATTLVRGHIEAELAAKSVTTYVVSSQGAP